MKTMFAWFNSLVPARRWLILIAVLLLLAAGAAVVYRTSASTAWYRVYSANRLVTIMHDHPSGDARAIAAWTELWRRHNEDGLSAAMRSALIDQCLAAQAAGPAGQVGGEIELLADCCRTDRMTPAQQATFLRQLVTLTWRVRPRVAAGDAVPLEVTSTGNLLDTYQLRLVDAKLLQRQQVLGVWPELLCTDSRFASTTAHAPCPGAGHHDVSLQAVAQIWKPGIGEDGAPGYVRCHDWPVTLSAAFEVIPADRTGNITILDDASLKDRLLERIRPRDLTFLATRNDPEAAAIDGRLVGILDVNPLPTGVAFEVIALARGQEYPLGRICRPEGLDRFEQPLAANYTGPRVFAVDILLRANPSLARQTVDLDEAWQGDLLFKNVPVRIPGPGAPADSNDWDY